MQRGVAVARETFDKQVDMKPSEKYVTPHTRTLSKLVGFFQTYIPLQYATTEATQNAGLCGQCMIRGQPHVWQSR